MSISSRYGVAAFMSYRDWLKTEVSDVVVLLLLGDAQPRTGACPERLAVGPHQSCSGCWLLSAVWLAGFLLAACSLTRSPKPQACSLDSFVRRYRYRVPHQSTTQGPLRHLTLRACFTNLTTSRIFTCRQFHHRSFDPSAIRTHQSNCQNLHTHRPPPPTANPPGVASCARAHPRQQPNNHHQSAAGPLRRPMLARPRPTP